MLTYTDEYGKFRYTVNDDETITISKYSGSVAEVVIPSAIEGKVVTEIGYRAFADCSSLESISLPDGLKFMVAEAFKNCTSLKQITIPALVAGIRDEVFYGCKALTSVNFNGNTSHIGKYAFAHCESLTSLTVPQSVTYIEDCAFYGTGLKSFVWPENCERIPGDAFGYCKNLTEVILNENVTTIVAGAFRNCTSLTEFDIPESVDFLGNGVFSDCTSLKRVTIPALAESIPRDMFSGCVSLNDVIIPEGISSIEESAFQNCNGLSEIILPASLKSIYDYAFYGCENLRCVTIPGNVKHIGENAFFAHDDSSQENDPSVITIADDSCEYGLQYARDNNLTIVPATLPVIESQPADSEVDSGKAATFSVAAIDQNVEYLWQYKLAGSNTWVDWTSKTTPSITVAYQENRDGMSLRCKIKNIYGKTAMSNAVTLTYKKVDLVITNQPESATVSEGVIASFSVKATGSKLKYLWQYRYAGSNKWVDWTTKTTASITVAYSASRNGMSLRCKITDGDNNTEVSDPVTLKYSAKGPSFTSQPVSTSVESGTIASFSVKATGTKLTYLWQYKKAGASTWTDWSTKTTAAITVAYDKSRDGMSLRCKITDGNGSSVYSDVVTMTYKKASDIVITKQPASTSVEANTLASFSLTATGTKLTYLWQYKKKGATGWTDWSTKTTAAITVAYDKSRDGMSLRCKITDGNGDCIYSDVVTMTYKKASDIVITKQPASTSVAANTLANFSVTATGTKLTYLWQYKKAGASTWTDWTTKTKAAITVAYDKSRDGMSLRCVITDGNGESVYSNTATLTYSK